MNVSRIFLQPSLHQTTSSIQIYSAILLAMEQDQLALQKSEKEPLTIKTWSDALSGSFLKAVAGAKKGKKVCESPKVPELKLVKRLSCFEQICDASTDQADHIEEVK